MPNSPLLLDYLCFGTRFLEESSLTTEVFILTFWLGRELLPWQRGGMSSIGSGLRPTLHPCLP